MEYKKNNSIPLLKDEPKQRKIVNTMNPEIKNRSNNGSAINNKSSRNRLSAILVRSGSELDSNAKMKKSVSFTITNSSVINVVKEINEAVNFEEKILKTSVVK